MMQASLFTLGIAVRAALFAGLAIGVIELFSTGRLYATALVVAGLGLLVLADLARYIARGDRMLARFIEGLIAEDFARPAGRAGLLKGFRGLAAAIDRAVTTVTASRSARQQEIDYLRTLIDNLSAPLFIVEEDGAIALANRAGHALSTHHVRRLQDCPAIGDTVARRALELKPGERQILRLATGQRVLASTAWFAAGGKRRRLISLENIDSELDAVELKAWQDLVRILSHEMMNSLTPIVSLAESARTAKADDVEPAIEAIARRSSGLMSFVERYRKVADLPQPTLCSIRISELLARLVQLMSAAMVSKGIVYTSRIEREDLTISGDPELLEQALINLLHNAMDAVVGIDGPCIELVCTLQGDRVAIRVIDNGLGLDAQSAERVFVPFFTTKAHGSGIGLALARQIALVHRGRLDVAKNEPRGAVFTLTLPAQ